MIDSLKEIMIEIQKQKAIAEAEPGLDVNVRRMQQGKARQAKERLRDLYMEYRKSVMVNSLFIVAVGSSSKKFAAQSADQFSTYSFGAEEMFESIADKIPESLYKNVLASRALFDHIMARFEERALEIDIVEYTPILFTKEYKKQLKGKDELISLLKTAFGKTVGHEVVGLDSIDKATQKAVNEGFEGKVVPIVLHTKDANFAKLLTKDLNRISPHVLLVKAGKTAEEITTDLTIKTISDKNLKELFLNIKEQVI